MHTKPEDMVWGPQDGQMDKASCSPFSWTATGGMRSPPHASCRDAVSVNENSLQGGSDGTACEENFCTLPNLALNQKTNHITRLLCPFSLP